MRKVGVCVFETSSLSLSHFGIGHCLLPKCPPISYLSKTVQAWSRMTPRCHPISCRMPASHQPSWHTCNQTFEHNILVWIVTQIKWSLPCDRVVRKLLDHGPVHVFEIGAAHNTGLVAGAFGFHGHLELDVEVVFLIVLQVWQNFNVLQKKKHY